MTRRYDAVAMYKYNAILMAFVWPIVITAVFLPLAVRKYQAQRH